MILSGDFEVWLAAAGLLSTKPKVTLYTFKRNANKDRAVELLLSSWNCSQWNDIKYSVDTKDSLKHQLETTWFLPLVSAKWKSIMFTFTRMNACPFTSAGSGLGLGFLW